MGTAVGVGPNKKTENEEETTRVKTQAPQWRTVFCLVVLLGAAILIMCLPRTSTEGRAGVVIFTTALLWATESMPLMITALVPLILFPFAGIMTAKEVATQYFNDTNMLMLGTFLMAESIEACGLHRRIALKILSLLGHGEALLILGATLTTWKLSMFMSNNATTALMLPIIGAIITSLRQAHREEKTGQLKMSKMSQNGNVDEDSTDLEMSEETGSSDNDDGSNDTPEFKWFCKGLILSIPYGASIGGIATLTGTPPNLVFQAYYTATYQNGPTVDYGTWMAFAYPTSFLTIIVGWHVLVLMYARKSYFSLFVSIKNAILKCIYGTTHADTPERIKWRYVNKTIRKKYRQIGPFRFPEVVLFIMIGSLVLLWILRDPSGIKGWAILHYDLTHIPTKATKTVVPFLTDSWVVIVMGVLLFSIPTENPLQGAFLLTPPTGKKFARSKKLLTWEVVMRKTPWDVIILLGGGFALAKGCQRSGLTAFLGKNFSFLDGQPSLLIGLVIAILVACLTEVASNVATTTLLMPIIDAMSKSLKINPLYLLITGCMSASLAFCLPSATGPNAMVFSFKEIKVVDMLRTGVFMNVLSVLIVVFAMSTWGRAILNITDVFPTWAN